MKHKFIISLIILGLILNTISFITVDQVEGANGTPEPYLYLEIPNNSFGISEFKMVNWSFFRNLFRNNFDWLLEYDTGSGWQNGNQYLNVNRTWINESDEIPAHWKFTLGFNKPQTQNPINARFTFALNINVLSYVSKISQHTYLLNYSIPNTNETYYCVFNWSDMINIPNVIFTHGIQNNMFWFRFRRDNIPPQQAYYEFDPTFGETGTSVSGNYGFENEIRGSPFTCTSSGTANSITARIRVISGTYNVKCAIYLYSDLSFVGETEERVISFGGVVWETFNITGTVNLVNDEYLLVIWSDSTASSNRFYYLVDVGGYCDKDDQVYNGFPDPYTQDGHRINRHHLIYCTYTEGVTDNDPPIISNPDPSNNSIDITGGFGANLIWSCLIQDNTTFNWSIECSYTGESNSSTGDTNGTKNLTIIDVAYNTTFIIWVNATDGNNSVSEWFNFTSGAVCQGLILQAFTTSEFIFLIALILLISGVHKRDSILGALNCGLCAIILIGAYLDGLLDSDLNQIAFFIILISIAVIVYKAWLFVSEKNPEGD